MGLTASVLPTHGGSEGTQPSLITGPWLASNGSLYAVIFDNGVTDQISIQQGTSVGGVITWTDVTGSYPGGGPYSGGAGAANSSATFLNGIIYLLHGTQNSSHNPNQLGVDRFDTATNTWLSILVSGAPQVRFSSIGGPYLAQVNISIKPSGKIQVVYNGSPENIGGTDYSRTWWSEYDGATWSAGVEIPGQTGIVKHILPAQILVDSSSRCYVTMVGLDLTFTNMTMYQCSIDDGGSFNTFQTVVTDCTVNMGGYDSGCVGIGNVYVDGSNVERIAIPYADAGTMEGPAPVYGPFPSNKIMRAQVAADPVWTVEVVDTTLQMLGWSQAAEAASSTAWDPTTNTLTMVWVNPTGHDAFGYLTQGDIVASYNLGSGWSVPTAIVTLTAPYVPSGVAAKYASDGTFELLTYRIDSSLFNGTIPEKFQSMTHVYYGGVPRPPTPSSVNPPSAGGSVYGHGGESGAGTGVTGTPSPGPVIAPPPPMPNPGPGVGGFPSGFGYPGNLGVGYGYGNEYDASGRLVDNSIINAFNSISQGVERVTRRALGFAAGLYELALIRNVDSLPREAVEIRKLVGKPISFFTSGVDTNLITYQIPVGYEFILYSTLQYCSDPNFIPGSGTIYWRFLIGLRYFKDHGNSPYQIGEVNDFAPLPDAYRVGNALTLTFVANVTNDGSLSPSSTVIAGFQGWVYPMRRNPIQ